VIQPHRVPDDLDRIPVALVPRRNRHNDQSWQHHTKANNLTMPAVARQQPRLRWAAGTRPDGSTLLVTDLAGGWIPPGIGIPGDVELPDPGSFAPGRTLQDLLGDNEFASRYAPGEQLGDITMDLSDSPRRVEPVATLARDLRDAAEWRNRLPVIARTLAKFQVGARPLEVEELRRALDAQRAMVLDSYAAGATDMHSAGNWMLMAAIDAVHGDDPGLAAYTFGGSRCAGGNYVVGRLLLLRQGERAADASVGGCASGSTRS